MFKFSFRQQVFTGFIVSLGLVFAVFYFSYKSIDKLKEDQVLVTHTEDVIETANRVQALLLDGETGQRGYIATSKENFLEPYNKSIFQVPSVIQKLALLTTDNPIQQNNIDSLNKYALLKRTELAAIIEGAKTGGFENARVRMQDGRGKYYMDQVRAFVQKIVKEENRLLIIRKSSTETAAGQAVLAIFVGGLVVVCVVLILFFYIQKTFAQQKKPKKRSGSQILNWKKYWPKMKLKTGCLPVQACLTKKCRASKAKKNFAQHIIRSL
jgi:CHASE3 domain sensor protein